MPRRCGEPIKTKASESKNFAGKNALEFKADVRFLMLKKKPCQIHEALKKIHTLASLNPKPFPALLGGLFNVFRLDFKKSRLPFGLHLRNNGVKILL
jgi:hypothetical protein